MKILGKYRDLYFQSHAFLVADVFENFVNICHKIYELDLACICTAQGLVWQSALKKQ